ncbi:transcriptional regulator [Paraburkholderia ginsengiterrae]|uniref:Transcriptional regulator n=1 Tax=Paraburkholderia ginsengiterrae TaxID=1462993 RepID=A0A1A9N2T8_9BURK|nr:DUF1488 domain-containing protein [Paraburkholderia ginsengiterrae]OAJ53061.1 transcriptional regulator [Paraburkholderia ginsengiterrae]OAJ55758.1 transcriptional regulator [Paraburkholderia ginsengiterrae]
MRVTFPDDKPVFDGSNLTVGFIAHADGQPVECAITAEALEDHFGADSALEASLLVAFEKGLTRIHSVCAQVLGENGGKDIVLHSGLFRMEGKRPDRGPAA